MNEWIDVSPDLTELFPFNNYSIEPNSNSILVSDGLYNIVELFSLIQLNTIESIIIGNGCFENVDDFEIYGLDHLKSLKIGNNSFTRNVIDYLTDECRSFRVLNCAELKSIEIGKYSFQNGGLFELRNLPTLHSIVIGEVGSTSNNFYYSSFVIEDNNTWYWWWIDLPNLYSIELGDHVFQESHAIVFRSICNKLNDE